MREWRWPCDWSCYVARGGEGCVGRRGWEGLLVTVAFLLLRASISVLCPLTAYVVLNILLTDRKCSLPLCDRRCSLHLSLLTGVRRDLLATRFFLDSFWLQCGPTNFSVGLLRAHASPSSLGWPTDIVSTVTQSTHRVVSHARAYLRTVLRVFCPIYGTSVCSLQCMTNCVITRKSDVSAYFNACNHYGAPREAWLR